MAEWRATNGHSKGKVDNLGTPLISKLCKGQLFSYEQSAFAVVQQYLSGKVPGSYLGTLALCVWVLTVFKEWRGLMEQVTALLRLPSAGSDEKTVKYEDGSLIVTGITRGARWALLLSTQLPRFIIMGFLCVVGAKWICQTASLSDLVLNAIALEFVMDIDELTYQVLVSTRTQYWLSLVASVPLGPFSAVPRTSIPWSDFVRATLILGTLLSCAGMFLWPFQNSILAAQEAMCGGNRDFSMELSGTYVRIVDHTTPLAECGEQKFADYVFDVYGTKLATVRSAAVNVSNATESPPDMAYLTKVGLDYALSSHDKAYCDQLDDALASLGSARNKKGAGIPASCNIFNSSLGAPACALTATAARACRWDWVAEKCERSAVNGLGEQSGNAVQSVACKKNVMLDFAKSCQLWTSKGKRNPFDQFDQCIAFVPDAPPVVLNFSFGLVNPGLPPGTIPPILCDAWKTTKARMLLAKAFSILIGEENSDQVSIIDVKCGTANTTRKHSRRLSAPQDDSNTPSEHVEEDRSKRKLQQAPGNVTTIPTVTLVYRFPVSVFADPHLEHNLHQILTVTDSFNIQFIKHLAGLLVFSDILTTPSQKDMLSIRGAEYYWTGWGSRKSPVKICTSELLEYDPHIDLNTCSVADKTNKGPPRLASEASLFGGGNAADLENLANSNAGK
eukprot:TRINITY_DN5195_c0_g1_i1.p1 TRINITY_DN5195_c0_g1~~TRINITY_DN5195_c0_g1_i1.p1  ORF type:complete len:743 (-),score=87.82 TRINITY_DN5195_c0_g1_i1:257-2281(-)